jgi:menaquinone-dependent protoporphyrinogen oxidase
MARILVVYGTAYGQTQRIAGHLMDLLAEFGHELAMYQGDHLPADLDLDEYDAFVVAASIIRGRHQPYIRDFVREHAAKLNAASSAFVSVSGAAANAPVQAGEYLQQFFRDTGWYPSFSASFAGAMAYTRYGWVLRWIMKAISRKNGGPTDTTRDHEMTDWLRVYRFAAQLAAALPPPERSGPGATFKLAAALRKGR